MNSKMSMYWFASLLCFVQLICAAPVERIMVDMSYVYNENVQIYPIYDKFKMTVTINGSFGEVDWIQAEEFTTATHMGTHMDAPSHFIKGGLTIDQIPISRFIAPAAVINITARAKEDRNAVITVQDLQIWENTTGVTLDGTMVLMNSGWGKKWNNRTQYIGSTQEDAATLNFPGFSGEASQWLVDNRDIVGIGTDTLSVDAGNSPDFPSHHIVLGRGLFALENVANLDKIPVYGATLYMMPMHIEHASGAPTRVIATFPKVMFDY